MKNKFEMFGSLALSIEQWNCHKADEKAAQAYLNEVMDVLNKSITYIEENVDASEQATARWAIGCILESHRLQLKKTEIFGFDTWFKPTWELVNLSET